MVRPGWFSISDFISGKSQLSLQVLPDYRSYTLGCNVPAALDIPRCDCLHVEQWEVEEQWIVMGGHQWFIRAKHIVETSEVETFEGKVSSHTRPDGTGDVRDRMMLHKACGLQADRSRMHMQKAVVYTIGSDLWQILPGAHAVMVFACTLGCFFEQRLQWRNGPQGCNPDQDSQRPGAFLRQCWDELGSMKIIISMSGVSGHALRFGRNLFNLFCWFQLKWASCSERWWIVCPRERNEK